MKKSGRASPIKHFEDNVIVRIIQAACRKLEIDRAVAWSVVTQCMRILMAPLTMFLLLHCLDVKTQGYVYAFGSVLGISIFLEMGFTQNILQFASHEFAKLRLTDQKSLEGDPDAYSRLVSLGRFSLKYFGIAAVLFLLISFLGGYLFFSQSPAGGVAWQIPWLIVCITTSVNLLFNPCWSLLGGCNQVAEVEKFRFLSSFVGSLGVAVGLFAGMGLYAITLSGIILMVMSFSYMTLKFRNFFKTFLTKPQLGTISWKHEIWPLQWRIGISWMCGYFIFSALTPIIFRFCGPEAAGRLGFTGQVMGMVASISAGWMTTKTPKFGMLAATRNWPELNRVWWRTAKLTFGIVLTGSMGAVTVMVLASNHFPYLANRYSGWLVASLLGLNALVQSSISALAYYLRAFKKEPFMRVSIFQAVISICLVTVLTWRMGELGAAIGTVASALITLWPASYIFWKYREIYTKPEVLGASIV